MRKRAYLFLVVVVAACTTVQAQRRNANWVFGTSTWFQFPDSLPPVVPTMSVGLTILPMQATVSARSAGISDTAGQFLLLADDSGIRNSLFEPVAGGSAAQLDWQVPGGNYLILPMPGKNAR